MVSGSSSTWIAADLAASYPALQVLAELMKTREPLAVLPTPLHHAPRLSASLGREVWIKRDDLTGTGLGGNKIRKLELLAARARGAGADTLISVGAQQSNHARTVAAAAAMLRMECHLVLGGNAPARPTGNLLLDSIFGAHLHWAGTDDWAELAAVTDRVGADLARAGRRVFTMPVGGSVPHGTVAFVAAYAELMVQCRAAGLAPSALYCASSSGGTQAGLHLGAVLWRSVVDHGAGPTVIGVDVAKISDPLADRVAELAGTTADLLGVREVWDGADDPPTVLTDYLGPGYARPTPGSDGALHLIARNEGIMIDPVYSAKALHALCEADGDAPVVFWHTGGVPALFAAP